MRRLLAVAVALAAACTMPGPAAAQPGRGSAS
jgi:hypothetical protein